MWPICRVTYNSLNVHKQVEIPLALHTKEQHGERKQRQCCGPWHFQQCVCLPLQMNGRCCEQQRGLSEWPWDEGTRENTHIHTLPHTDLYSWYLIAAISSWLRADHAAKRRVCWDKPCRAEGLRLLSRVGTLEVLAVARPNVEMLPRGPC